MAGLFAIAIFTSATLLFVVQPMAGKILLPVLGGGPGVWSTCLVFFQGVLLLGYLYAHVLSTRVGRPWQRPIHLAILVCASLWLPIPIAIGAPSGAEPEWWTLAALARTVGLPFFALAATAPLLQQWFSDTSHRGARDPYFLYAVSNAGSLAGLIGYLLLEPVATRTVQARGWAWVFWTFAAMAGACAYVSARRSRSSVPSDVVPASQRHPREVGSGRNRRTRRERPQARPSSAEPLERPVSRSDRALWIGLALVPSALLLGVTQHLSTDVLSAPLFWVVPLALYLITFMAAFASRQLGNPRTWGAIAPAAVLVVLVLSLAQIRYPILPVALAHLAAFTILAMLCHTRLAERRPDPAHLTGYFVCIAFGGVIGSAAAALVAPAVFSSVLEYPLAMAAALLLRPQSVRADRLASAPARRWGWRLAAAAAFMVAFSSLTAFNTRAEAFVSAPLFSWTQTLTGDPEAGQRLVRALFVLPALALLFIPRMALPFAGLTAGLLVAGGIVRTGGDVLARERTFFGVHEVTSVQNGDWHVLTHGTTTHGIQAVRGKGHVLPTAYYHPSGPLGDVVFTLAPEGRFRDVGVVGLGAGALAGYVGDGVRMDFFEVDEAVIRIAENPRFFTYLSEARARAGATVRTIAADGRLGLRAMPAASYDLIVIDAFSSDAIPSHLITREAVALYASRLKTRGVMAFHVSSRFFDLRRVLARIAAAGNLVAYARDDQAVAPERAAEAMRPSVWVVLARDARDLGQLAASTPRWVPLTSTASDPLWTDDYTAVLAILER